LACRLACIQHERQKLFFSATARRQAAQSPVVWVRLKDWQAAQHRPGRTPHAWQSAQLLAGLRGEVSRIRRAAVIGRHGVWV
jgi:hypothetical protein